MSKTLTTTRSFEKFNNLEDYGRALMFLWDADIRDPIDFIIRKDCTTEGLEKVIKRCPKDHLKSTTFKNHGSIHKFQ